MINLTALGKIIYTDTFIHFMNGGIERAEFHHFRAHQRNETPIRRTTACFRLWCNACGLLDSGS